MRGSQDCFVRDGGDGGVGGGGGGGGGGGDEEVRGNMGFGCKWGRKYKVLNKFRGVKQES